jgi:uncharacterized protein YuzE
MQIHFDPEADAVLVRLRDPGGDTAGDRLNERRIVHYDQADRPVAVELLFVSQGIDLEGLPEADRISVTIRSFPCLAA